MTLRRKSKGKKSSSYASKSSRKNKRNQRTINVLTRSDYNHVLRRLRKKNVTMRRRKQNKSNGRNGSASSQSTGPIPKGPRNPSGWKPSMPKYSQPNAKPIVEEPNSPMGSSNTPLRPRRTSMPKASSASMKQPPPVKRTKDGAIPMPFFPAPPRTSTGGIPMPWTSSNSKKENTSSKAIPLGWPYASTSTTTPSQPKIKSPSLSTKSQPTVSKIAQIEEQRILDLGRLENMINEFKFKDYQLRTLRYNDMEQRYIRLRSEFMRTFNSAYTKISKKLVDDPFLNELIQPENKAIADHYQQEFNTIFESIIATIDLIILDLQALVQTMDDSSLRDQVVDLLQQSPPLLTSINMDLRKLNTVLDSKPLTSKRNSKAEYDQLRQKVISDSAKIEDISQLLSEVESNLDGSASAKVVRLSQDMNNQVIENTQILDAGDQLASQDPNAAVELLEKASQKTTTLANRASTVASNIASSAKKGDYDAGRRAFDQINMILQTIPYYDQTRLRRVSDQSRPEVKSLMRRDNLFSKLANFTSKMPERRRSADDAQQSKKIVQQKRQSLQTSINVLKQSVKNIKSSMQPNDPNAALLRDELNNIDQKLNDSYQASKQESLLNKSTTMVRNVINWFGTLLPNLSASVSSNTIQESATLNNFAAERLDIASSSASISDQIVQNVNLSANTIQSLSGTPVIGSAPKRTSSPQQVLQEVETSIASAKSASKQLSSTLPSNSPVAVATQIIISDAVKSQVEFEKELQSGSIDLDQAGVLSSTPVKQQSRPIFETPNRLLARFAQATPKSKPNESSMTSTPDSFSSTRSNSSIFSTSSDRIDRIRPMNTSFTQNIYTPGGGPKSPTQFRRSRSPAADMEMTRTDLGQVFFDSNQASSSKKKSEAKTRRRPTPFPTLISKASPDGLRPTERFLSIGKLTLNGKRIPQLKVDVPVDVRQDDILMDLENRWKQAILSANIMTAQELDAVLAYGPLYLPILSFSGSLIYWLKINPNDGQGVKIPEKVDVRSHNPNRDQDILEDITDYDRQVNHVLRWIKWNLPVSLQESKVYIIPRFNDRKTATQIIVLNPSELNDVQRLFSTYPILKDSKVLMLEWSFVDGKLKPGLDFLGPRLKSYMYVDLYMPSRLEGMTIQQVAIAFDRNIEMTTTQIVKAWIDALPSEKRDSVKSLMAYGKLYLQVSYDNGMTDFIRVVTYLQNNARTSKKLDFAYASEYVRFDSYQMRDDTFQFDTFDLNRRKFIVPLVYRYIRAHFKQELKKNLIYVFSKWNDREQPVEIETFDSVDKLKSFAKQVSKQSKWISYDARSSPVPGLPANFEQVTHQYYY